MQGIIAFMSESPPRRRWFQFGLGTMFWTVVVASLALRSPESTGSA